MRITADKLAQICTENQRRSAGNLISKNATTMTENEISYTIRGAIFKVYNNVGPGLLESAYEAALAYELKKEGFAVATQMGLPFVYETINMDMGYRIDILVENKVIIEVKSVDHLADVHFKQLLTYLKLSDKRLGILVNFNTDKIDHSIKRIVNNLKE
jgi:GxxExxY protein